MLRLFYVKKRVAILSIAHFALGVSERVNAQLLCDRSRRVDNLRSFVTAYKDSCNLQAVLVLGGQRRAKISEG